MIHPKVVQKVPLVTATRVTKKSFRNFSLNYCKADYCYSSNIYYWKLLLGFHPVLLKKFLTLFLQAFVKKILLVFLQLCHQLFYDFFSYSTNNIFGKFIRIFSVSSSGLVQVLLLVLFNGILQQFLQLLNYSSSFSREFLKKFLMKMF